MFNQDPTYLDICLSKQEEFDDLLIHSCDYLGYDNELFTVPDEEATRRLKVPMYRVTKAFRFYYDRGEHRRWVYVPEGFLTDGASVPEIFQWIIAPWGRHGQAAVVHDLLCIYRTSFFFKHSKGKVVPTLISNFETHWVFLEAMRVSNVPRLRRSIMYWAVRGYFFFKRLRNKGPLEAMSKKELRAIYRERGLID